MKPFYVPFERDTNLHDQIYMHGRERKGRNGCNGMDGRIACKKPSGFKKLNETTTIGVKVQ